MSNAPNFNRIARAYRAMEYITFGRLLERCRFAFLPRIASAHRALILGDGDGRFLARLMQQSPTLHATAVDASPAMLRLLANNCIRLSPDALTRLTLIAADIRAFNLPPASPQQFDLIASHFFLDCLTTDEISALASRLAPHLSPNALWLVSDFSLPDNPLLRIPARLLIHALYLAFGFLTGLRVRHLPHHRDALTAAGWHCISQKNFAAGLLFTELWSNSAT